MRIFSSTTIGAIAHSITQILVKSLRVQIVTHPEFKSLNQYAYGFWHDKQFAPIMQMAHLGNCKHAALVSASRDGEILSTWLSKLGYHIIRGSSSRKAISSVVKLLNVAKEGYSVGIAADGPRGPRHEAKSGLAFLAHKAGLEIVPLGVAYSKKLKFSKAWDQYQLPLPFSKLVFYFGQPFSISDADMQDIDTVNAQVAAAIQAAEMHAELTLAGQSQVVAENIVKMHSNLP